MEFNIWAAIVAGLLGGVAMSLFMTMLKQFGLTVMDMELLEGAIFTGSQRQAKLLGLVIHVVMMSAVVIGSIYALLFANFGVTAGNAWWVGAGFGVVHGLIAGTGMAMMPVMHPRMGAEPAKSGGIHLHAPGLFARNYGRATPVGVLAAHILYGLVVGFVYGLLA